MNLSKGKAGDWDILVKTTDMTIADVSEDYGWELILFFEEVAPAVVVVVGKPERIDFGFIRVAADVLRFKYILGIPKSGVISIKCPLGISVSDSFKLRYAIGIRSLIEELEVKQPLSFTVLDDNIIDVITSLGVTHIHEFSLKMNIGKTIEKSIRRLKKLKEVLEEL